MKFRNWLLAGAVLCASGSVAMATAINFNLEASWEMFQSDGTTYIPQDAFYQVWWSPTQDYADTADQTGASPGQLDPATALLTKGSGPSLYGDYVLRSGADMPQAGSWGGSDAYQRYETTDVGGAQPSSGFVYVYVYDSNTPTVGSSYIRSQIYPLPATTWSDPDNPLLTPPTIDLAPEQPALMGTHFVVPEPASMALFGIGMLTIAARRRRK
ncbi:MAG: PEP-CTERM sorting domain-containing protein [Lentisphaerae bacterium]|nr:PEP-CTERM sorting domain-containing protein [Lentisphaerota bacterium]